ncbi:MAG TPA: uracil-DNA glycosylase [Tepidisphaeraceae bacterium]|nr:uracil-DNA glycosylase [Tepidisphaeraceae bacterium]
MDGGVKNRLRLWLRSERALGLSASLAAPPPPGMGAARVDAIVNTDDGDADSPADSLRESQPSAALYARLSAPNEMAPRGGMMPPPSVEPFTAPLLVPDEKRSRLIALDNNEVRGCTRCRLCQSRTNTVFGEGDPDARIFFIGEGPGENEDLTGRPFVGRAGELLDKMIAGMGLRRDQVYIANIVKCRPPNNRVPMPDEVATCTPYLERQLEIIRPDVIVTLGLPALKYMMNDPKLSMGRSRGSWREWRGIKLMPTFHPAYILRNPTYETKAAVWSDLKQVLVELGLPIPKRSGAGG